jgi:hypothetical protein
MLFAPSNNLNWNTMFTDACGKTHYEFWEGIKLSGKSFHSVLLYNLCLEYGDAQVRDACIHLGLLPYAEDLSAIRDECQRQEDSYV